MPHNADGTFTLVDGNPACPPNYTSNDTIEDIALVLNKTPTRTEVDTIVTNRIANCATRDELAGLLETGTVMLFQQATAPTGWTQSVGNNNSAIRIVETVGGGSGGTADFTTVFSSYPTSGSIGGHALTVAQMPSHTHNSGTGSSGRSGGSHPLSVSTESQLTTATTATGGNQPHSHTFTGNVIDLSVKYADVILCSKD